MEQPTIYPEDFSKEFYIIADGSKIATSGILAQN